jgi:adenine-specific DNA-methyltransferase
VSRLTDLITLVKAKDPQMGMDLEREFRALSSRLAFGLNFERHRPEVVELPQRPVRKGDKVRILPERGSAAKGDQRLWVVKKVEKVKEKSVAHLELLGSAELETQDVSLDDLVVVAEFRDYIYPGLVSTGKVERGGDKPFHTVINGENYHVLKALTYTHRGKVDVIYIDPPYNSGAKDWKYNNYYVESEDIYRHSKWLAFMERRILIAKELLNPNDSILIVTIDEKEYLRLGLLLEQTFPEAKMQMVTSVISPSGQPRANQMSRVEEYIYVIYFGGAKVGQSFDGAVSNTAEDAEELLPVSWENLIRRGTSARRQDRENQFFPLIIDPKSKRVVSVGDPLLPVTEDRASVPAPTGLELVWPIRSDGSEGRWRISSSAARSLLTNGYLRLGRRNLKTGFWAVNYVLRSDLARITAGEIVVEGHREDGSAILVRKTTISAVAGTPKTVWSKESHNAGNNGSALLRTLLPGRAFPFPKSLYAVEDTLRLFVAAKKEAIVLDFFAGSGTTAHATMRLNRQDGGRRQCISVTNNEVAADELAALRKQGLRSGDPEWELLGICDYITKPRVEGVIRGQTPNGEPIKGNYKFTDEFPMADGFEENAEFFTLTYETPVAVSHNFAFERVAPLLWMRAGSQGRLIDTLLARGWDVADTYGLLTDLDHAAAFCKAVEQADGLRVAYIVTNDDRRFQAVTHSLPDSVEPVRLYESYLSNFKFANGE